MIISTITSIIHNKRYFFLLYNIHIINTMNLKFFKYNKYNKPVFIASNDIDRYTVNKLDKINNTITQKGYKYSPIYIHQLPNNKKLYYITANLSSNKNTHKIILDKDYIYNISCELRLYNKVSVNLFLTDIKPVKLDIKYEILETFN